LLVSKSHAAKVLKAVQLLLPNLLFTVLQALYCCCSSSPALEADIFCCASKKPAPFKMPKSLQPPHHLMALLSAVLLSCCFFSSISADDYTYGRATFYDDNQQ
jgi:hypothetical protein